MILHDITVITQNKKNQVVNRYIIQEIVFKSNRVYFSNIRPTTKFSKLVRNRLFLIKGTFYFVVIVVILDLV